jgi:hypothetical protein
MLNSLTIISPAKLGKSYTYGLDWWGYQSKPGFKGDDHFVVRVSSDKGDSDIDVTVHIQ